VDAALPEAPERPAGRPIEAAACWVFFGAALLLTLLGVVPSFGQMYAEAGVGLRSDATPFALRVSAFAGRPAAALALVVLSVASPAPDAASERPRRRRPRRPARTHPAWVPLVPPQPQQRCPWCHADVGDEGLVTCTGCATAYHGACADAAAGCATLGCANAA